jgi:hypothetical protein
LKGNPPSGKSLHQFGALTAGNRYMQASASMAGDAQSRAERAYLGISRKEQQQLVRCIGEPF